MFLEKVSVSVENDFDFELRLEMDDGVTLGDVPITIRIVKDGVEQCSVPWRAGVAARQLTIGLSTGQKACLVACIAGTAGAGIADCLSSSSTVADFIKCIKNKAAGILVGGSGCIYGCLSVP